LFMAYSRGGKRFGDCNLISAPPGRGIGSVWQINFEQASG
jgi:hypothetical protein